MTHLRGGLARLPQATQDLLNENTLSAGQIGFVYVGNGPAVQAALAGVGPLAAEEANLQKALHTVNVQRPSQTQPVSLYAHLKSLGLDPTKIVAVDATANDNNVVFYYAGPPPVSGGSTGS
jgi:ABC-type nitrate/sulfonate/bicarbonate transport system substrate-binding protein